MQMACDSLHGFRLMEVPEEGALLQRRSHEGHEQGFECDVRFLSLAIRV